VTRIVSKAATPAYRKNYERVFRGRKVLARADAPAERRGGRARLGRNPLKETPFAKLDPSVQGAARVMRLAELNHDPGSKRREQEMYRSLLRDNGTPRDVIAAGEHEVAKRRRE